MDHVTDDRTDRPLGRDLRDWLERSVEELPDGAELPTAIRSDVLSRLSGTPQRRRWWPLRWFPFGLGATRSAERSGPRPEGRSRSMLNATRIVASVAILAVAGSLAFVGIPTGSDREPIQNTSMDDIDPSAFGGFSGTIKCGAGTNGKGSLTDWGVYVIGETWPRCTVETNDPRMNGNNYAVFDYYVYDGQPEWGVRSAGSVVTTNEGAWVGTGWGYEQPETGTMFYVNHLRGTDAYDGLSAILVLSQETWGVWFDVQGIIYPGDLPTAPQPPLEDALAYGEALGAD